MTTEGYLKAYDLAVSVSKKLNSGSVGSGTSQGYQYHIGHKHVGRFHVISRVIIGPRGGIYGMVYLWDSTLKPAVDSIRVGEVPDFGRHPFLELAPLFWNGNEKSTPDEQLIRSSIREKLESLSSDESFYEEFFKNGHFDTPSRSVDGFQGGAPGLKG
jgi:hypothetical protein